MAQPVKKNIKESVKPKKKIIKKGKKNHKEYGTSKLEEKFMYEFLDRLNVKYDYQYKAENIGRYFDFYLYGNENGGTNVLIEIQGGYWHSDPRLYEGKELNATQKHNKKVDALKKKWADEHRIPLYYFWEKDINENPQKVMNELKGIIIKETKNFHLLEKKKQRPKIKK